jgi:DNA-binding transcriptional MerR regulator
MQIGEIARKTGIPTATIRYYEAEKLISRPTRTASGYRVFSERVLEELTFIRRAQGLGLTLDETREILNLGRAGKKPCARVTAICDAHLVEIDRRMAELQSFRENLQAARALAQEGCGFTPEGFCRAIFSANQ